MQQQHCRKAWLEIVASFALSFAAFVSRCLDWVFWDSLKLCTRFWVVKMVGSVWVASYRTLCWVMKFHSRNHKAGFTFLSLHMSSIWFFICLHLILNGSRFMNGLYEWKCLYVKWCWVMLFASLCPKSCMKSASHLRAYCYRKSRLKLQKSLAAPFSSSFFCCLVLTLDGQLQFLFQPCNELACLVNDW